MKNQKTMDEKAKELLPNIIDLIKKGFSLDEAAKGAFQRSIKTIDSLDKKELESFVLSNSLETL
jgi:hypothetical protein